MLFSGELDDEVAAGVPVVDVDDEDADASGLFSAVVVDEQPARSAANVRAPMTSGVVFMGSAFQASVILRCIDTSLLSSPKPLVKRELKVLFNCNFSRENGAFCYHRYAKKYGSRPSWYPFRHQKTRRVLKEESAAGYSNFYYWCLARSSASSSKGSS